MNTLLPSLSCPLALLLITSCSGDPVAVADAVEPVADAADTSDAGGVEDVEVTPLWSTCPDEPLATAESLSDKAAGYGEIATRLHLHPDMPWIMPVGLATQEVPCEDGAAGVCTVPVAPESEATWEDVATWHTGENDGLWSGLYLASLAFQYAVTGSEEALATLRWLLDGEVAARGLEGEAPCDPLGALLSMANDFSSRGFGM